MSEDGHNSKSRRDIWLKHQAVAILDQENRETLNATINRHRKQAKADGIELADLDWVIKVIKWPVGDIVAFFRRRLEGLGFNNINIGLNAEDASGAGHTEDQRYAGTLAGMQGKACSPPANLTPNERETWIAGWHEGNKARDAAQFDLVEEQKRADAAKAEAKAKGEDIPDPEPGTELAERLGGAEAGSEGYGEDGGEAATDATAEAEPGSSDDDAPPPHQPAKKSSRKKAEAVH